MFETIKKSEIPRIRRSKKDQLTGRLFSEFEKLIGNDALKIETKELGCSLGGVIYVIKHWNETNPDRLLTHTIRNSRTNPVVYVYKESNKN